MKRSNTIPRETIGMGIKRHNWPIYIIKLPFYNLINDINDLRLLIY